MDHLTEEYAQKPNRGANTKCDAADESFVRNGEKVNY